MSPCPLSTHTTTRVVSFISKLKKKKEKKEQQEILILNEKKKKKQLNITQKWIDLARLYIQTNKRVERESMHTTNELENIRQRILESINRSSKKTLKKHHRQESNVSVSSVSSTETTNGGFEFVESRGEWSMIYDELTGARCSLMK